MATAFDRDQLLAAFDEIGQAAVAAQYAAGHCGVRRLGADAGEQFPLLDRGRGHRRDRPAWPDWLSAVVERIAARNGWPDDWLNEAVTLSLEPARKSRA